MNPHEAHYAPDGDLTERDYVRRVLEGYLRTPTTVHMIRGGDRAFAARLYREGVPVQLVEDALVMGAIRRLFRPWDAPRLEAVRSLRYFEPIIEEFRREPPPRGYMNCQRWKLHHLNVYNLTMDPNENDRLRPLHYQDEHCDVGENGGRCRVCFVWHGDPCPWCGGRAFHRLNCGPSRR